MPELTWIGKDKVVNHHHDVPFRVLEKQYTFGDADSGNKIIHGDNLEALKSLLPEYEGRINCIYIDPPYNTGNENWVYNDNVNDPKFRKWLHNVVGKEGEDLTRHDKWLCMMYPRLKLLRKLMGEEGVMLISIDDFEVHHMRCLLNEIFGVNNVIAQLVWDKTRKNDAKLFSVGHEYVIVVAKSLSKLRSLGTIWREQKPGAREIIEYWKQLQTEYADDYKAIQDKLREWYKDLPKDHPSRKLSRHRWVDKNGPWRDRDISWIGGGGPRYDVIHPETNVPCVVPERGWGFATPEEMQRQIDLGLIEFREDHTTPPFCKSHLLPVREELERFVSEEFENGDNEESAGLQVMSSVFNKQAQVSVKLLRKIFAGQKVFPNPKDHEVLARLIHYVAKPEDIILDSFAGSGTTAHAILKLNATDGGKRKFILIEQEQYAETITAERVRRVIKGYGEDTRSVAGFAGGFDYYETGAPLFHDGRNLNEEIAIEEIRKYVAYTENLTEANQLPITNELSAYLLGVQNDTAYFFFYEKERTTTLDLNYLSKLTFRPKSMVFYADICLLNKKQLQRYGIIFKKIPRDITRF